MAVYLYKCDACGLEVEICHSMKECDEPHLCQECQTEMHRLIQPTLFGFGCPGFHQTDAGPDAKRYRKHFRRRRFQVDDLKK